MVTTMIITYNSLIGEKKKNNSIIKFERMEENKVREINSKIFHLNIYSPIYI